MGLGMQGVYVNQKISAAINSAEIARCKIDAATRGDARTENTSGMTLEAIDIPCRF